MCRVVGRIVVRVGTLEGLDELEQVVDQVRIGHVAQALHGVLAHHRVRVVLVQQLLVVATTTDELVAVNGWRVCVCVCARARACV